MRNSYRTGGFAAVVAVATAVLAGTSRDAEALAVNSDRTNTPAQQNVSDGTVSFNQDTFAATIFDQSGAQDYGHNLTTPCVPQRPGICAKPAAIGANPHEELALQAGGYDLQAVPEPTGLGVFGIGLIAAGLYCRRQSRRRQSGVRSNPLSSYAEVNVARHWGMGSGASPAPRRVMAVDRRRPVESVRYLPLRSGARPLSGLISAAVISTASAKPQTARASAA
jgi:hypothetical protein